MGDIPSVKVVGRLGLTIGDGADPDEMPDTVWCDGGVVRFTPVTTYTKVTAGVPVPWTAGHAVIDVPIDSSGYLTWQGSRYIWMLDLTSTAVNPHVEPGKATHKVQYLGVTAQGVKVAFGESPVRLAADTVDPVTGVCDLTLLTKVPAVGGSPITVGPAGPVPDLTFEALTGAPGTGVQVVQSGTREEPVVTLTVPAGAPGGSDAATAEWVETGPLTKAALDASIGTPPSDLTPLYVTTIETIGCRNAAPGARTGLPTTTVTVTTGDGGTQQQGYAVERTATGVSGTAGAYTLTVTDAATLSALNGDGTKHWEAAVVNGDGRAITVSILSVAGGTATLLNPLPITIEGGTLSSRNDEPAGQHLTRGATRAYAQQIAALNGRTAGRGALLDGSWDTAPAPVRPRWTRNAALLAYGASASPAPVVVSNRFDSGAANPYDAVDLLRRPNGADGGPQIGTHLAGHGATETIRTAGRPCVIEWWTYAQRESTRILPSARLAVTATADDGAVLYSRTVAGGMHVHRVHVTTQQAVTIEVTNADGGIYYIGLQQLQVREAGRTTPAPRRVLLVGDSWTQYYDHLLGAELSSAWGCRVETFGRGGVTVDWCLAWLDTALAQHPETDLVVLHSYTNDLNNVQGSPTAPAPGGGTMVLWPPGLTSEQARARWAAKAREFVARCQARGLRVVVIGPGTVNLGNQAPGHGAMETPALADWSASTTEVETAAGYLNAVGKRQGRTVLNATTGRPLWASGSGATAPWADATGAAAHTPA